MFASEGQLKRINSSMKMSNLHARRICLHCCPRTKLVDKSPSTSLSLKHLNLNLDVQSHTQQCSSLLKGTSLKKTLKYLENPPKKQVIIYIYDNRNPERQDFHRSKHAQWLCWLNHTTSTHAEGFPSVLLHSKLLKSGCFLQLRVPLQKRDFQKRLQSHVDAKWFPTPL